jgi:molecular chaperone GrpE
MVEDNQSNKTEQDELEVESIVAPEMESQAEEAAPFLPQNVMEILKQNYVKETEELKNQLLRSFADMENLRKRTAKQIEDSSKYAVTSFAKDLINVMENMYRAIETIPNEVSDNEVVKNIVQGVELVHRELANIFERNNIVRLYPNVGDVFDHNLHQAVAHIPSADVAAGSIVQTMQAGYMLGERLLRPAMVGVAKAVE